MALSFEERSLKWRNAFAAQAQSDWRTREVLLPAIATGKVDRCHELHYLQMACEKLCKAHLILSGTNYESLRSGHRAASKKLPQILRQLLALPRYEHLSRSSDFSTLISAFAREAEYLTPAVHDKTTRPENAEYPWEDASGQVYSPLSYNFPRLGFLKTPAGSNLLKLLAHAITHFDFNSPTKG